MCTPILLSAFALLCGKTTTMVSGATPSDISGSFNAAAGSSVHLSISLSDEDSFQEVPSCQHIFGSINIQNVVRGE